MTARTCLRAREALVSAVIATCFFPMTVSAQQAPEEIVLHATHASAVRGAWQMVSDAGAAGGARLWLPDAAAPKQAAALAAPTNYVELTFTAQAGRPYRLWMRGKADRDSWANDSVFYQFSGSVTATGAPTTRIGTTASAWIGIEDCSGCSLSGWGWQDNGYGLGVLGPLVYFEAAGPQTIRIQQREDGISIDQIVLSAGTYLTQSPGATTADATILTESAPPAPPAPPVPPVPPTPTGPVSLRILQWNLHHGVGSDGVYSLTRIAAWMAQMNPDVIMLNEVEKYTGWGNENQPERYRTMLEASTGKHWYSHFAQEYGSWASNGKGHQILSTFPFEETDQVAISHERVIAEARIIVNGRPITLTSTHLDPDSQPVRLAQAKEVTIWCAARPEDRILTGDFNAWPDQSSIAEMNKAYLDSWAEAAKTGHAYTFAGNNPIGATKNGRIDYIFYSKGASNLSIVRSDVIDTRNATGVMPSDHRPVVTTFEVR